MTSQLIACYATTDIAVTLRADTADGVAHLLSTVVEGSPAEPVTFTIAPPGSADLGEVQSYMVGAIDPTVGVGALRYTSCDTSGQSSWHSLSATPDVTASSEPRLSGFPPSAAVPMETWVAAVIAFRTGDGQRPSGLAWQPVAPASGEAGADATSLLAKAVLTAASHLARHRHPPGLPPPGEDLASPDRRPAPVDLPVAAGHLRAVGRLLAAARHRVRAVAGAGADGPGWTDALARLNYASDQLAALVPSAPGEVARLPRVDPTNVASIDGLRQQLITAANEIDRAHRRLRSCLECAEVPATAIVASVELVVSGATTPLRHVVEMLDS